METLTDWPDDLPPERRDACGEVELGFGDADPRLKLEFRQQPGGDGRQAIAWSP
jgi:hypothetical protein